MARLLICRHGETTWNRSGRVQGWAPVPLTAEGRAEAERLAKGLADEYNIDRLMASDLRRAMETARPVGRETDLAVTADPAWRERDFGCLQGLTIAELFDGYPEFALGTSGYAAATAVPESGESLLDQWDRVLDAFVSLVSRIATDETIAVVTHGGPLYAITGHLKGLNVVEAVLDQDQQNGAVNELRIDDGSPTLVAENVTYD